MKVAKQYNITPAKGQALLNFQGRRSPSKIDLFEANVIEEVRNKGEQVLFNEETDLNSNFCNLLMHGDCLSTCAYLKSKNIKIDLVYIDPPFASGANYAKKICLRNGEKSKIEADGNTIGEEVMYGDIWQKEDYLNWLYERLLAIRDVMDEMASVYVHLDWHIGHYAKVLLDEVFGEGNFVNEIVWCYTGPSPSTKNFPKKHDVIFLYSKSSNYHFQTNDVRVKYRAEYTDSRGVYGQTYEGDDPKLRWDKGKIPEDWWADMSNVSSYRSELVDYNTQKPEALLERIIKVSSTEGMIVADFFSGSGTSAKVAHGLNRKFVTSDIGINAVQTTRDRLVEAGASFDILKIQDGVRLFRNPAQTTAKIFNIIEGFKPRADLDLNEFWHGGIVEAKGAYSPVKFSGIHDKLTKELLDVYLEEIYKLEDARNKAQEVIIIYAHKEIDIDQDYLNRQLNKAAKTELKVKLVSLDSLLGEKKDALFTPDNAKIKISEQGGTYKVKIERFYSSYLKNKVDAYNVKKVKKGMLEEDLSRAVKISTNGLELIEAVQFDTTLGDVWKSNLSLEDKAGVKEKIKGVYTLNTKSFKIKIRNIAGDEIIIDSAEMQ